MIVLTKENKLYVVDHNNNRIQRFDTSGNLELMWGTEGSGAGQFIYPWGIAELEDMILVSSGSRIQFFSKDGAYLKEIGFENTCYDMVSDGSSVFIAAGNLIIKLNSQMQILDRISIPNAGITGIDIAPDGSIVVCDVSNRKIHTLKKKQ